MEICKYFAMQHEVFRTLIFMIGAVVGLVGLCLAWRRVKAIEKQAGTDANRLFQERYQKGAQLMGELHMHTRLGGVVVLADLAEDPNAKFKARVEMFFLAYMAYPVKFPMGHEKGGEIDYESRETIEVVRKLLQWETTQRMRTSPKTKEHIRKTIKLNKELHGSPW